MSQLATFTEEELYSLIALDDGKANALGFAMFEAVNAALQDVTRPYVAPSRKAPEHGD